MACPHSGQGYYSRTTEVQVSNLKETIRGHDHWALRQRYATILPDAVQILAGPVDHIRGSVFITSAADTAVHVDFCLSLSKCSCNASAGVTHIGAMPIAREER